MHCDTIMVLEQESTKGIKSNLAKNENHIDIKKLEMGNYLAQCFAMFVPLKNVSDPFETCLNMIDRFYLELSKNSDKIAIAKNYDDIIKNQKEHKISAILTVEEGGVIKKDLRNLRNLYRLGVRMITLTWNYENGIGFPNFTYIDGQKPDFKKPNTNDGLTNFGISVVEEMNRLGIIIDVSHLSDAGFYDVLKYSKAPFVASHSNARSICNHVRNLTDDMIKKLADKGGVIGINFCSAFINENDDFATIEDIIKHIDHIIKIGGINCVGLGTDFDGIDSNMELKDASYLPLLEKALKEHGYTNEDIDKIMYQNVLRVLKNVLK